jgi:hypothetical protein
MSPHWLGLYIACLGKSRNRGFRGDVGPTCSAQMAVDARGKWPQPLTGYCKTPVWRNRTRSGDAVEWFFHGRSGASVRFRTGIDVVSQRRCSGSRTLRRVLGRDAPDGAPCPARAFPAGRDDCPGRRTSDRGARTGRGARLGWGRCHHVETQGRGHAGSARGTRSPLGGPAAGARRAPAAPVAQGARPRIERDRGLETTARPPKHNIAARARGTAGSDHYNARVIDQLERRPS